MYQRAWTVFNEFFERLYRSSSPKLPLSADCLTLFISHLSARKLAPSTITSYLSAIGYVHKMRGLRDPTKSFLIHKLLTALGRRRAADIRLPISRAVLHELVRSLKYTNSSASQRTLYSAMFLTAFYGFFRIGELATKSSNKKDGVVQYGDVSFLTNEGVTHMIKITISSFKHNSDNRPFSILIKRETSAPFCPVQAIMEYSKLRGHQPGPFFCLHGLSPITVSMFNTELHRCLVFCGLDTTRYKSHSFRIGAACHAAEQGFSDAQIRTLGRWKSDAFKTYLRSETLNAN